MTNNEARARLFKEAMETGGYPDLAKAVWEEIWKSEASNQAGRRGEVSFKGFGLGVFRQAFYAAVTVSHENVDAAKTLRTEDADRARFWEKTARRHEQDAVYYRERLVDAEAMIGRLLLQFSERWDLARITKYRSDRAEGFLEKGSRPKAEK